MKGVLLVNLGTPAAPTPEAVKRYLGEFLSDPRVVPLPRWLWLPLLHGVVLPRRGPKSAEKYALIWTQEGSPLAVHTEHQARLLGEALGIPVEYAMRYGGPDIRSALKRFPADGLRVVPLYPQFAESTTAAVADCLPRETPMVRDFHDHPGYIAALAANVRRHWNRHARAGVLLMSFHGLPKRSAGVYENQCRRTASLLAAALGLEAPEWRVTFQSRFGYAEWLRPYTDETLRELAKAGTRRVDVVCPGFVSDCLETLEEIGIVARRTFLAAGGQAFYLVPCLNESPEWIAALAAIARGTT